MKTQTRSELRDQRHDDATKQFTNILNEVDDIAVNINAALNMLTILVNIKPHLLERVQPTIDRLRHALDHLQRVDECGVYGRAQLNANARDETRELERPPQQKEAYSD